AAANATTAAAVLSVANRSWKNADDGSFKVMTFRIPHVSASQYVRLRGTNMPASVPYETDGDGNPLPDLATNASKVNPTVNGGADGMPANANPRSAGASVGENDFAGCPAPLPVVNGQKMVAFDVAAW